MVEVKGAELKTKGGPKLKIKGPKLFFGKFYILKKKIFGPGGARAPFALHLGPSLAGSLKEPYVRKVFSISGKLLLALI